MTVLRIVSVFATAMLALAVGGLLFTWALCRVHHWAMQPYRIIKAMRYDIINDKLTTKIKQLADQEPTPRNAVKLRTYINRKAQLARRRERLLNS